MTYSDYLIGVQPGQGVNLSLKKVHGFAVTGEFKPTLPTAPGRKTTYSLSIVKSFEQLSETLSVSGSVSYADVFSASASAEFTRKSSVSRYSTFVVAKCIVQNPAQTITRPQITESVIEEAKTLTKDEFTRKYGTEFLAGIIPGSYYFGVIQIESTSESQQQEIAVAVSASGWGADANASVASALSKVTSNSSTKVFAIRDGYRGGQANPLTVDDVIKQVVDFGKADWQEVSVVMGIFQPYTDMSNLKFKDDSQGDFQSDKRSSDLNLLGKRYIKLSELQNAFEFVSQHFSDSKGGKGVKFSINGQEIDDLESIDTELLKKLKPAMSVDAQSESLPITMNAIAEELHTIQSKLDEIASVADACKAWREYKIPEAYVAKIGLPEIYGENMELKQMEAYLVPSRTIMLWSGIVENIPTGWLLCNGTKGTPDLRDRFVCGAGPGGPEVNAQGDAESHSHFVDPPSVSTNTSGGGDHRHRVPDRWYNVNVKEGNRTGIDRSGGDVKNDYVESAGGHTHSVTIDIGSFSSLASISGKPKWYALCYIMKQ